VLVLPQSSVAVHVRVTVGQAPTATLSLSMKLKSTLLSQLSLAVALPVTPESVDAAMASNWAMQLAVAPEAMQSTLESAGQVIVGAALSVVVIV
tara:strand:- start:268 stop:549 length:282 start_codon:yes stop_codon:yes gene_type:complete